MQFTSANDLKLDDITYEWMETCTDLRLLKKAIKLIEEDGNYFIDLKNALKKRISELFPQEKDFSQNSNKISEDEKFKELEDLYEWKLKLESAKKLSNGSTSGLNLDDLKRAENEKNKGNEAMNSSDFKEAILFYNNAIKINPNNALFYGNRSQAFLKLKDFRKTIEDSTMAVNIDPNYVKGFYRRAIANENLGNFFSSACDFKQVMFLEKDQNSTTKTTFDRIYAKLNSEEISNLKVFEKKLNTPFLEMNKTETNVKSDKSNFIQIQIEEDEDEENEKEIEDPEFLIQINKLKEEKSKISKNIENGDYLSSIKELQNILGKVKTLKVTQDSDLLRLSILNNIAFCYKKSELNSEAIQSSHEVVNYLWSKFEGCSITEQEIDLLLKAIVRRALAYEAVEKPDAAYKDYSRALLVNPHFQQALTCRNKVSSQVSVEAKNQFEDFKRQTFDRIAKSKQLKSQNNNSIQQKSDDINLKEETTDLCSFQSKINEDLNKNHSKNEQKSDITTENEKNSSSKNIENGKNEIKTEPSLKNEQNCENVDKTIIEKKEVCLNPKEREFVISKKAQGNEFFTKKNYKNAIFEYKEALSIFPQIVSSFKFKSDEDLKIYCDISSNLSLACNHVKDLENGLEYANQVLHFQPTNLKAKYRKVINLEGLIDKLLVNGKIKDKDLSQGEYLIKDILHELPLLLKDDQTNDRLKKMYQRFNELSLEIASKRSHLENNNSSLNKIDPSFEESQDFKSKSELVPKLLKEKIEKQTAAITKMAMQEVLKTEELPATSSEFETDLSSLKENWEYIFEYLSKIPEGYFLKIYKKKQIEYKFFMKIVVCFTVVLDVNAPKEFWLIPTIFFSEFIQTFAAKLTFKMCIRKEKQSIFNLVQKCIQFCPEQSHLLKEFEKSLT